MVNRPKKIGTEAESAVVKALQDYYPQAKRITLAGADDKGDIDTGDGMPVMIEVKGGKQCQQIGDMKLAGWMAETDRERDELGKRYGFLVTQRAGFGLPRAAHWWAWVHLGDLAEICGGHYRPGAFAVVRLELRDLLELLADHGLTADKERPDTAMPETAPVHIIDTAAASDLAEAAALFKDRAYQSVDLTPPVDPDYLTAPAPRADDWN